MAEIARNADARLRHIRERLTAFRPDPSSAASNRAIEDMKFLVAQVDDLRSRLGCVAEATYWDRPYDTRIDAIRGMCDLTTNGMNPASEIWECGPHANAWNGHDARCRRVATSPQGTE